jgi:hypothetical protein
LAGRRTVLFATILLGAMLPAASAGAQDPVDEVVETVTDFTTPCNAIAATPVVLQGQLSYEVQGAGGGDCGPTADVTALVCLEYNLATIASTCEAYSGTGSASGVTGKAPCAPGVWQTSVTVVSTKHAAAIDHSLPLIVVGQCSLGDDHG